MSTLHHYLARLSLLVCDVVDDPDVDIPDVITFLSAYDELRKPLDRVQANKMKGRIVGDTMKHFSTMDDEPRRRVTEMAGDAPEIAMLYAKGFEPVVIDEGRTEHLVVERPEREGREGDSQPMPKAVEGPIMHEVVIKALEDRLAVGIKRYGQPLRAFNGRDPSQDAFEEVLDLSVYLAQMREEMREMREVLSQVLITYQWGGSIGDELAERMKRAIGAS